jgi:AhpD family alkylhydroperoxidase
MLSIIRNSAAAAALALVGLASLPAHSEEYHGVTNLLTYSDIQKHFRTVPKFFELFPEAQLPALWQKYKSVQLNPNTVLEPKVKQLIGLAVAAQANCKSCIYFQTTAAFANGATTKEIQETVAVAVTMGDWSRILTESTFDVVKQDTNKLAKLGTLKAKTPATTN